LFNDFSVLKEAFLHIESLCQSYNLSINELALKYVMSKDYIDGVLIGVDSLEHLITNIRITDIKLPQKLIEEIDNIVVSDEKILNPMNWLKN
jgi:aryl-alcohol dehydrogenase-like predicted oxidoreductase